MIEILVLMGNCSTASSLVEAWGSSKSIQKLVSFTHSVDSQQDKNMTYVFGLKMVVSPSAVIQLV